MVTSELGLRAGADPVRRLTEQELRAWGFEVVYTAPDLERLAAVGARVLWVHHDALSTVDPAWARERYADCRAIGVLDGTVADLADRFGLGENGAGWIQPGGTRPVFALLRAYPCPKSTGRAQTSDWLSLSWLLSASSGSLIDPSSPGPDAHDLEVTNDLDESVTIQLSPASAGDMPTDAERRTIG